MATISNTPRPGYAWDATDNCWYPIGTGPHTHGDYITSGSAINPTIVDAKGDIIAATAADTVARLAVGSNDTVLTADSSTATGLKWGTVSAGSNWSLLNSGGTALTGAATVTVSGISAKDKILVLVSNASSASASTPMIRVRFNTDTAGNYFSYGYYIQVDNAYSGPNFTMYRSDDTGVRLGRMGNNADHKVSGYCYLTGCNASGVKAFDAAGGGEQSGGTGSPTNQLYSIGGVYNSATVISSISVNSSTGNLDDGIVYVYTSA